MRRLLLPLVLVLVASSPSAGAGPKLWLHVRVEEGDATQMVVNLPLSLVGAALPMIDGDGRLSERSLRIDDHRLSYAEMRDLWRELRDGPDMAPITIEEPGESVRIWKESGFLHARIRGQGGKRVEVRMRFPVVDALLGGETEFDLEAALAALSEQGEGDLVEIEEDGKSVRVWIDRSPEAPS